MGKLTVPAATVAVYRVNVRGRFHYVYGPYWTLEEAKRAAVRERRSLSLAPECVTVEMALTRWAEVTE